MLYHEYIKSEQWFNTRNKVLSDTNCKCKFCGSKYNLQVHHLTYKHLGCELKDELVVLCAKCHLRSHFQDRKWRRKHLKKITKYRCEQKEKRFRDEIETMLKEENIVISPVLQEKINAFCKKYRTKPSDEEVVGRVETTGISERTGS